jgi:hypothetical protein
MLSECILKRFITKHERTEKTLSADLRHYLLFLVIVAATNMGQANQIKKAISHLERSNPKL